MMIKLEACGHCKGRTTAGYEFTQGNLIFTPTDRFNTSMRYLTSVRRPQSSLLSSNMARECKL
ncbi:hypothetical protein E2C01_022290 [Portunus trituberculatus]|uniref:Uncharacterized protein n=1 Tax=Portunus trituberculatus TaxID=210409 RepID=A0A5B7E8I4_PORTR|nr:hypothetical protein [Portunus trituberculatus]